MITIAIARIFASTIVTPNHLKVEKLHEALVDNIKY